MGLTWEYFDFNREQSFYLIKVEEIVIMKFNMLVTVIEEEFGGQMDLPRPWNQTICTDVYPIYLQEKPKV